MAGQGADVGRFLQGGKGGSGSHLDLPTLLLIKAGVQLYGWWSDGKGGSWGVPSTAER